MPEVTPETIQKITHNLKNFGYGDLTEDFVRERVSLLMDGEKPTEIIGMMAKTMLEEAGLLEDS